MSFRSCTTPCHKSWPIFLDLTDDSSSRHNGSEAMDLKANAQLWEKPAFS